MEQKAPVPHGAVRETEGTSRPHVAVRGRAVCDTPGVSFVLRREIYPNLGRSVKFSFSRSHLSPFIRLLVKVSPISDFIRISRTTKFGPVKNF
jgi:hypothetical protein